MNNKINIAEILKDCPKGMELYSPIYGKVELSKVDSDNTYPIIITIGINCIGTFTSDGRLYEQYPSAECLLFPSREMRDWTKFFKRGDVVYNKDGGLYAIFEGWVNDDYTEFNTTINYYESIASFGTEEACYTDRFVKVSDKGRAMFIANAEKYYGGKYNPETLRVEPVKVAEPKCSFKPFDKVLVRYGNGIWGATFFSRYDNKSAWAYVGVDCINWEQCIPYEGNEHLLGTDKSPE